MYKHTSTAILAIAAAAAAALLAAGAAEPAHAQTIYPVVTCKSTTSAIITFPAPTQPNRYPASDGTLVAVLQSPPPSLTDQDGNTRIPTRGQIFAVEADQTYTLTFKFRPNHAEFRSVTTFSCADDTPEEPEPPTSTDNTAISITPDRWSVRAGDNIDINPTITVDSAITLIKYKIHCETADGGFVGSAESAGPADRIKQNWRKGIDTGSIPSGSTITCTITISDITGCTEPPGGYTDCQSIGETQDAVTVTLTGDRTSTPSAPSSTPSRSSGGGGSGGGSGGSSGGGGGFSGFAFVPSAPRPAAPAEPEPYQPTISNGTISNVKLVSVPLNATIWYGTITEPLQCDIEPTGHFNITGTDYTGMTLHDIIVSNVTHANATDTAPATYNVTVSTVAAYDMTALGFALLDVHAGGIDWTILQDTMPAFRDIFGTVDIREITQYGNVTWAAADGSCRAP